ncbi:type II toxin-antitoxin system RelE/ParE family toxin [Mesorhizobium yinganensis]|uniref:type II toxin-antitoxin system RelE/ParE family toxin n=1 Tax=Mesorhizobium yinganensis TaxID=3157707 RepID=UPI003CCDD444
MKLKILPRAVRDLAEIRAYISLDSEYAADAVSLRIKKSLNLISARPGIGRPSTQPRIREHSVPGLPYVVPYRIRGETVEILRIFHTSRERPLKWIG